MKEKIITNPKTGFMKSSNEGKLDVSGMTGEGIEDKAFADDITFPHEQYGCMAEFMTTTQMEEESMRCFAIGSMLDDVYKRDGKMEWAGDEIGMLGALSISLRLLQAQESGKYPSMNFMNITEEDRDRIYDSAKRHLYQYLVLKDETEDHLGAFYANCMFLWILNNKKDVSEIYNKFYKNGHN